MALPIQVGVRSIAFARRTQLSKNKAKVSVKWLDHHVFITFMFITFLALFLGSFCVGLQKVFSIQFVKLSFAISKEEAVQNRLFHNLKVSGACQHVQRVSIRSMQSLARVHSLSQPPIKTAECVLKPYQQEMWLHVSPLKMANNHQPITDGTMMKSLNFPACANVLGSSGVYCSPLAARRGGKVTITRWAR